METNGVNGNINTPRQWVRAWLDNDGLWNIAWRDRQGNEWVETYEVRGRPATVH